MISRLVSDSPVQAKNKIMKPIYLIVVFLYLLNAIDALSSVEYFQQRNQLISLEKKFSFSSNIVLNEAEMRLNELLFDFASYDSNILEVFPSEANFRNVKAEIDSNSLLIHVRIN